MKIHPIEYPFYIQAMINSFGGQHGLVKTIFDREDWHTVDNDIFYFGYIYNTLHIVFTGSTGEWADWESNFGIKQLVVPYGNNDSKIRVHQGFLEAYKKPAIRDVILAEVKRHTWNAVVCIGHSRGAALATLCAVDIQYNCPNVDVACITAGSPRVGNKAFADSYNNRIKTSIRVVNCEDFVTKVPYAPGYWHVDKEYHIGGYNPLFWLPIVRSIAVLDHYPQKYLENINKKLKLC